MIINIDSKTTLKQITDAFKNRFPYLKIEFFIDSNHDNKDSNNERIKNQDLSLAQITNYNNEINFSINGKETIKLVEEHFKNTFGVMIQVFYKRSNTWIMSTTSDNITLDALNAKSMREAENLKNEPPTDAADRMDLE